MSNFEDACRLSCEEWADSLPDSPEYELSDKGKRKLKSIISRMKTGKLSKMSKRSAGAVVITSVIAAALLIGITANAVVSQKAFNVADKGDMAQYSVSDSSRTDVKNDLELSYTAEGFSLTETERDSNGHVVGFLYEGEGRAFYFVDKYGDSCTLVFDKEEYEPEEIVRNGISYIYFKSDENNSGLVWNYNEHIYCVSGTISLDEAFKVADSIKID